MCVPSSTKTLGLIWWISHAAKGMCPAQGLGSTKRRGSTSETAKSVLFIFCKT